MIGLFISKGLLQTANLNIHNGYLRMEYYFWNNRVLSVADYIPMYQWQCPQSKQNNLNMTDSFYIANAYFWIAEVWLTAFPGLSCPEDASPKSNTCNSN